jgi:hypothetical protein
MSVNITHVWVAGAMRAEDKRNTQNTNTNTRTYGISWMNMVHKLTANQILVQHFMQVSVRSRGGQTNHKPSWHKDLVSIEHVMVKVAGVSQSALVFIIHSFIHSFVGLFL